MARVLVTGVAGFIGVYVAEELLAQGYEVVGIDNFSKGGRPTRPLPTHQRFRFVDGDVKDADLLLSLLKGCNHLIAGAAMVGGVKYINEAQYEIFAENETIAISTFNAALQAFQNDVLQKITLLGSSTVYESAETFPLAEEQALRLPPPKTSYGFQKLALEYLAYAAKQQHGLPYTVLRLFNAIGPGDHPRRSEDGGADGLKSHVVPELVYQSLRGGSHLKVLGDGKQVRHFCYAGDIARGIRIAMESPQALNREFNLAGAEGVAIDVLATGIWRRVNGDRPLHIVRESAYERDVVTRVPDCTLASRILGFRATTSMDAAIDKTIQWVRDQYFSVA